MTERVALVTGGAGEIGTAICRALAGKGCKVAAGWLEGVDDGPAWQAEQKKAGFDFAIVAGDVSKFEDAEAMVKSVEAELGPVDILVNCAGITKDGTLRRMQAEQWNAVIDVNLNSVFNVTKQVVDGMMSRGFGRVVNISSVNGQKGQRGQTNYAAAKAGMHGFTMSLAQEVANKGVTVNSVSPGYVATDMVMRVPEKAREQIVAQIPAGRLAEPSEIAWTVAFLADDQSAYITGANIAVNGGLHMGP
ncbi:MAG: acetoacetyl-CoA reductase [Pseudomonadota bacterium]